MKTMATAEQTSAGLAREAPRTLPVDVQKEGQDAGIDLVPTTLELKGVCPGV